MVKLSALMDGAEFTVITGRRDNQITTNNRSALPIQFLNVATIIGD